MGRLLAASAVTVAIAVRSSDGSMLADDNFEASSGVGTSLVTNAESSGVGTYATIQGTNSMTITNVAGFGSGNGLSLANGTQTTYRELDGATTLTLNGLAADQKLSLRFDVRFVGGFGGADNFSFGFVGSNPANSVVYANIDLSSTGGTPSDFRYRTGSFNMSDAGLIVGSTFTEPVTVSASNYVFQFDVTKSSTNGFVIDYTRNGVLTGTTTQTNGSTFANAVGALTISGIAFRHSQTPSVVTYIDNVSVTLSSLAGPTGVGSTNTAIALVGGNIQLSFNITSGAVYRVEATTNLNNGAGWTSITDPLTNRSGDAVVFADTNAVAGTTKGYRIASP